MAVCLLSPELNGIVPIHLWPLRRIAQPFVIRHGSGGNQVSRRSIDRSEMGHPSKIKMQLLCILVGMLALLAMSGPFIGVASAQARASRKLRSFEMDENDDGWEIRLRLDYAARILRQVPDKLGKAIRIQIDPLDLDTVPRIGGPIREVLPLPSETKGPLVEIAFEQRTVDESYVEIEFDEPMSFEVRQGDDLRILLVRMRPLSAMNVTGLPADPRLDPSLADPGTPIDSQAAERLERARVAIRNGELERASTLLLKIVESGTDDVPVAVKRDARELLGLTRHSRGQLAHARAEYERYLADYPDGEAADRVRQRLAALVTASSQPRPKLRKPTRTRSGLTTRIANIPFEYDVFGSVAMRYFRADSMLPNEEGGFLASDLLTDFDFTNRIDFESLGIDTDFTGTYDADLSDTGRSSDLRVSRLSILLVDKRHEIKATIGRQRQSNGGILGRFDGLHLSVRVGPRFTISSTAGLPVTSTSDTAPNTDTVFGGAAVDWEDIGLEGLQGQLFLIGQNTESTWDRLAVGGELRFSNSKSYSFLYLDYDVLFESLNTAVLSTAYYWTEDTDFRLHVERRNTPILQLFTALQGQSLPDIGELRRFASVSDLREIAKDRAQVLWSATGGITHRPAEKLQVSGDVMFSYSSSTNDVLDVRTGIQIPGSNEFGPDVSTSIQLLTNDWLAENVIGSLSARYTEGKSSRAVSLTGFLRLPAAGGVRINPQLRWEWRDLEIQGAQSTLRSILEIDWRYKSLYLNAESGIVWVEPLSGASLDRRTQYFVGLGARWEF
jgi:hypothetical protein